MYIDNRVLYDSDGNPCTIGDKVEITCDDGEIIIDTITDITDEQDKGFEDNEIYLQNTCIPLYNIEKVYKVFSEEKESEQETANGTAKATVKELKEMIVDLKVDLMKANIPEHHCPYAYYPNHKSDINCDIGCDECTENFFEIMRKRIEEQVAKL